MPSASPSPACPDSYSLDRKPTVPFDKLMDMVGMGSRDPEALSSLGSRLARLDRQLTPQDRRAIESSAEGYSLRDIVSGLINATDPDAAIDAAREETGQEDPRKRRSQQQANDCANRPPSPSPPTRSYDRCSSKSAVLMNRSSTT